MELSRRRLGDGRLQNDFRVGGREKKTFGPKGDPKLTSDGSYLDIVPDSRIVSGGTRLILTDQSVFFDGRETPTMRKSGWGQVLETIAELIDRYAVQP
jgi:hypothetical protein